MVRIARLIHIFGVVQGVGFRPFVYNLAISMKLIGWVKNNVSAVEIHIEACEYNEKIAMEKLKIFIERLKNEAPRLAQIRQLEIEQVDVGWYDIFEILESSYTFEPRDSSTYISYDVSTCKDCACEIRDINNRRYYYPFTNCTNCGPRFTIIQDIPYDRKNTTMREFKMCSDCEAEYKDPTNRRYHAQPIACTKCGPRLMLLDSKGVELNFKETIVFDTQQILEDSELVLEKTIEFLKEGNIIAIKGLGGYHLACDALNHEAVDTLRKRKIRDDKPFAIMVKDLETAQKFCYINENEKKLLESDKKPIVLLKKKLHEKYFTSNIQSDMRSNIQKNMQNNEQNNKQNNKQNNEQNNLPNGIAPGNRYLGVMLPYTPLHILLFEAIDALVMTSGNRSGEPIYFKDDDAVSGLKDIADYFLIHDREIDKRVDDSVTREFQGEEYIIRRSRGYVPAPIIFNASNIIKHETMSESGRIKNIKNKKKILAVGGELKNTFCICRNNEFFLSHHIGDLENYETMTSFEEGILHYKKIFQVEPEIIAYDMHPRYLSTQFALQWDVKVEKKIAIQHHHAHIASCMIENEIDGEVIGVALDGSGYGTDGNIWGGEFFIGGYKGFNRVAHLEYLPMPGGELAVKQPWRMALSYIWKLCSGISNGVNNGIGNRTESSFLVNCKNSANTHRQTNKKYEQYAEMMFLNELNRNGLNELNRSGSNELLKTTFKEPLETRINVIKNMIENNINSPLTSSTGRLFDAVAALCGIRFSINYEGQAAIELEYLCDENYQQEAYPYDFIYKANCFEIITSGIIQGVIKDLQSNSSISLISSKFHETLNRIVVEACVETRKNSGLKRVVLSGGVFQNITLLSKIIKRLNSKGGFEVYVHKQVPANDGGISLGQAAIAKFS